MVEMPAAGARVGGGARRRFEIGCVRIQNIEHKILYYLKIAIGVVAWHAISFFLLTLRVRFEFWPAHFFFPRSDWLAAASGESDSDVARRVVAGHCVSHWHNPSQVHLPRFPRLPLPSSQSWPVPSRRAPASESVQSPALGSYVGCRVSTSHSS